MDVCTLGLPCFLLLISALFVLTVSSTQKCVPQDMPDMVIDINQAVASGARFTEPLSVMSVEECLSACCMQLDMGGDLDCNFLVFDARKGRGLQNCYIFHCPTQDSCPLVPSLGVLSYSLWSEPSHPENPVPDREPHNPKTSDRNKVQTPPRKISVSAESGQLYPNLKKDSAAIASQGLANHYAKEQPADSSRSITSQLLRLADRIDQHLERMESEDNVRVHHPIPATQTTALPIRGEVKNVPAKLVKPDRVAYRKPEDLKIYFPTVATTLAGAASSKASLRLGTAAPQPVPHTKVSAILPPAAPQDVGGVKKVLGADVKSTKMPRSENATNSVTPKAADHPLPLTEVQAIATVPTKHPQMVTHPAPLQTSAWKGMKPSMKTNHQPPAGDKDKTPLTPPPTQQGPPRIADSAWTGSTLPSLEDKSGLVAALVFGVLFLMVVIGLVSRKVSEARRRHRYTKLDYLINGMYVDT
ncbi:MANSC domain-containing protein 1 [Eleutherodactylus coqui]|uniref:MANSC domain-containing protein 1 n=1 Tax=Eleutherodactylus coqui TaxID=57060 RepID=UPI0034618919